MRKLAGSSAAENAALLANRYVSQNTFSKQMRETSFYTPIAPDLVSPASKAFLDMPVTMTSFHPKTRSTLRIVCTFASLAAFAVAQSAKLSPVALYFDVVSPSSRINTSTFSLSSIHKSLVIDYGSEAAGVPYFVVASLDRPIQLEVKYSEELDGLRNAHSDGPFPFSTGLSNTFRVETFNVTAAGEVQSYFIQGGQRWQTITQLTDGHMNITEIGLLASINATDDMDNLPGYFACSNEAYNRIWKLGARASMAACVSAGSQNATWEITDDGVRVRGQKPAVSAVGTAFADYTLEFSTFIERGGTGWSIAQNPSSTGIQLLLVAELPENYTFVNTNTMITPPSSLVLAYGYSFVNQTTLPSNYLGSFELPNIIQERQWYRVRTSLSSGTELAVHIDNEPMLNVSLNDYGVSLSSLFDPSALPGTGSWGFGPWQDQVALTKDVVVTASNGTVLYNNTLRSIDAFSEYGVAANNATVCLDGPKRDRLVWLGDAFHTSRIVPASTARNGDISGTLQYFLEWQNEDGLLPIAPPIGYDTMFASNIGGYLGLMDYQTLGLLAYTGFVDLTGDIALAERLWPGFRRQANWLLTQINQTTYLAEIGGFTGPSLGTATSAALAQALNEVGMVAKTLGDQEFAALCTGNASKVMNAIETLLWNEEIGAYVTSLTAPSNYSVADISFAITSGIAGRNDTRLQALLTALENLRLGPGYKDSSSVSSEDLATNISPNINGFLLSALMKINATAEAKFLLDNLWTAMISNDSTSTGASWEYVNAHNLGPGLGLFTSLSHPWGGAPTYILPQWIAGIRPVMPGYKEWLIVPGILGFGVTTAEARVPTMKGTLAASWKLISDTELHINVSAPEGTYGSLSLPKGTHLESYSVDGGISQDGPVIELESGDWDLRIQFRNV